MNPDGEPGPLPGQLVLPGMPDPGPEPGAGQAVLPGLDDLRDPGPADDPELAGVAAELTALDRDGSRMAAAIRDALDMLLVQASDEDGTWSAGLLRTGSQYLSPAGNRDGKRALNDRGRAAVCWLHHRAALAENALIRLPERDVAAIFACSSGQQRVNELFRRAQRMLVSRTVVATVAMQDDYMKRVRDGGGARDLLRAEGIVIFGDYAGDQLLASALDLPRPGPGEFVSARLARRHSGPDGAAERAFARFVRLGGSDWLLASAGNPAGPAPVLPRLRFTLLGWQPPRWQGTGRRRW